MVMEPLSGTEPNGLLLRHCCILWLLSKLLRSVYELRHLKFNTNTLRIMIAFTAAATCRIVPELL
jgi:hypothetical protein